eukprot:gb/GECG01013018.1/.p1 GENE.gb/GECG01013018.1/~~gb/GECG01013018.1/.p1  ORF type:complete len:927 (+),score=107.51 gb/GECG01013018.1/:1-2781(+)
MPTSLRTKPLESTVKVHQAERRSTVSTRNPLGCCDSWQNSRQTRGWNHEGLCNSNKRNTCSRGRRGEASASESSRLNSHKGTEDARTSSISSAGEMQFCEDENTREEAKAVGNHTFHSGVKPKAPEDRKSFLSPTRASQARVEATSREHFSQNYFARMKKDLNGSLAGGQRRAYSSGNTDMVATNSRYSNNTPQNSSDATTAGKNTGKTLMSPVKRVGGGFSSPPLDEAASAAVRSAKKRQQHRSMDSRSIGAETSEISTRHEVRKRSSNCSSYVSEIHEKLVLKDTQRLFDAPGETEEYSDRIVTERRDPKRTDRCHEYSKGELLRRGSMGDSIADSQMNVEIDSEKRRRNSAHSILLSPERSSGRQAPSTTDDSTSHMAGTSREGMGMPPTFDSSAENREQPTTEAYDGTEWADNSPMIASEGPSDGFKKRLSCNQIYTGSSPNNELYDARSSDGMSRDENCLCPDVNIGNIMGRVYEVRTVEPLRHEAKLTNENSSYIGMLGTGTTQQTSRDQEKFPDTSTPVPDDQLSTAHSALQIDRNEDVQYVETLFAPNVNFSDPPADQTQLEEPTNSVVCFPDPCLHSTQPTKTSCSCDLHCKLQSETNMRGNRKNEPVETNAILCFESSEPEQSQASDCLTSYCAPRIESSLKDVSACTSPTCFATPTDNFSREPNTSRDGTRTYGSNDELDARITDLATQAEDGATRWNAKRGINLTESHTSVPKTMLEQAVAAGKETQRSELPERRSKTESRIPSKSHVVENAGEIEEHSSESRCLPPAKVAKLWYSQCNESLPAGGWLGSCQLEVLAVCCRITDVSFVSSFLSRHALYHVETVVQYPGKASVFAHTNIRYSSLKHLYSKLSRRHAALTQPGAPQFPPPCRLPTWRKNVLDSRKEMFEKILNYMVVVHQLWKQEEELQCLLSIRS